MRPQDTRFPVCTKSSNSMRAVVVSALGRIYTMTEDNYIRRKCGQNLMVRYSRSGELKDLSSCSTISPWVFHHKTYTSTFLFLESAFFLWTEKLAGWMDRESISGEIHDFVKQSMLESLMSLWKKILTLRLSTLLSRNWTLASIILGSNGWYAHLLSLTKISLLVPLLWRRRLGAAPGMNGIASETSNKGFNSGSWISGRYA